MWIARVVDNTEGYAPEFVGPMTQAQADKFHEKHNTERYSVYLEMLCKPSVYVQPDKA